MTREETAKLFAIIAATFPRDQAFIRADRTMLEAWTTMLSDIPFNVVQGAIQAQASISPFPPSISEIRKRAAEIVHPQMRMGADEAWEIARRIMKRIGCSPYPRSVSNADGTITRLYPTDEARAVAPPEVWTVMERMGYADMCRSENIDVVRGQFMRMWDAYSARQSEQSCLPPVVKALAEQMQIRNLNEGKGSEE